MCGFVAICYNVGAITFIILPEKLFELTEGLGVLIYVIIPINIQFNSIQYY